MLVITKKNLNAVATVTENDAHNACENGGLNAVIIGIFSSKGFCGWGVALSQRASGAW